MTYSYDKLILESAVIILATVFPAVIISAGWVWFGIAAAMLVLIYFRTSDLIIRAFQVSPTFKWILVGSFVGVNLFSLSGYYLTEMFGIGERESLRSLIIILIIPVGIVIGFVWDRKVVSHIQSSEDS